MVSKYIEKNNGFLCVAYIWWIFYVLIKWNYTFFDICLIIRESSSNDKNKNINKN